MDLSPEQLKFIDNIFSKSNFAFDEKNGIDYRLLGLVWQNTVEKQLLSNPDISVSLFGTSEQPSFKVKIEMGTPHSQTEQGYFVLDGLVNTHNKKYKSTIIEIKLGLQNIGLKEIEYLYYNPNAKVLFVLFYPTVISRPDDIYRNTILPLVDEFNKYYDFDPPYSIPRERVQFVDRSALGLDKITQKKLMEYEKRSNYFAKIVMKILAEFFPNSVLKTDIIHLTDGHHQIIGGVLQDLLTKGLIKKKTCDIMNRIDRVSTDVNLYTLSANLRKNEKFDILQSKFDLEFDVSQIPLRSCLEGYLRPNDQSILCYLSHFPSHWISVPDLLRNVNFSSQAELRRRLEDIVNKGWLDNTQGYLVDLVNTRTKSYLAQFYKLLELPEEFDQGPDDNCYCQHNPPQQIPSPVELSRNELFILLMLDNNQVDNENPVTISDLAHSLDLNQSTVNIAVKRLARNPTFPLKLKQGWVLSNGKITRLRSSPVVYLQQKLEQLNLFNLALPPLTRSMMILEVPLTPNEQQVLQLAKQGLELDEICQNLKLNKVSKSNRYMIKTILKRLADPEAMGAEDYHLRSNYNLCATNVLKM